MRIPKFSLKNNVENTQSHNNTEAKSKRGLLSRINDQEANNASQRLETLSISQQDARDASSGRLSDANSSELVAINQTAGVAKKFINFVSNPENLPFIKRSKKFIAAAKEWNQVNNSTLDSDSFNQAIRETHKKGVEAIMALMVEAGVIAASAAVVIYSGGLPALLAGGSTVTGTATGTATASLASASIASSTSSAAVASTGSALQIATSAAGAFKTAEGVQKSKNPIAKAVKRKVLSSVVNQKEVKNSLESMYKLLIKAKIA